MSVRRKNIRITPAKLRAQRANALLSRGPRTREGRRRSALNRRSMGFSLILQREGLRREARDLRRLWGDLLAQFWFIKPERWQNRPRLEFSLERAAWDWWQKLVRVRGGDPKERLRLKDQQIESDLANFLSEFRVENQKADYWLRKEFGIDGRLNIAALRESIEARLGAFREQKHVRAADRPTGRQTVAAGQDRRSEPATARRVTEQDASSELSRIERQCQINSERDPRKTKLSSFEHKPPGT